MAATETSTRAHAALDDLYRRHVGDVYRYTYAVLGNHADAEDVTQTTFVNALRALERGEQPQNPSNWLLAIAHNVVRQRWRQAAARPSEVELVHDVPERTNDDDVELDGLVRALQRIPPAQREALVMRELEGRSYREISELLGMTTSALETLLFRARRSLAEELENVVTCQNAELAISRSLDDRLSRKERRRLDEHLAECDDCARLAAAQRRQRKAFKGLALLPIPVGLAFFKGAPAASAAALPTIGLGATGASGTAGVGATGAAAAAAAGAGATGASAAAAGGAAVGGSLVGGAVAKVAAVVVAAGVVTGVGYEGVKAVRDTPAPTRPAVTNAETTTPTVGGPATGRAIVEKATPKGRGAVAPGRTRKNKLAPDRAKRRDTSVERGRSGEAKGRAKATDRGASRPRVKDETAGPKPKAKAPKPKPRAGKPPQTRPPAAAAPPDAATQPEEPSTPVTREPEPTTKDVAAPTTEPGPPTATPAPAPSPVPEPVPVDGGASRDDNGKHNGKG